MNSAKFNPAGGRLNAEIIINGIGEATYHLKLAEKESSSEVASWNGDNKDDKDDRFELPLPVDSNNGRVMRLDYSLSPRSEAANTAYVVQLNILQDDKIIGTSKETGIFSKTVVSSRLFIKLTSN